MVLRALLLAELLMVRTVSSFPVRQRNHRHSSASVPRRTRAAGSPAASSATSATRDDPPPLVLSAKRKTLGLLTFDLDDSLYPVDVVLDEANAAFANAMHNYGFGDDIEPSDIDRTVREIREELPPEEGLVLTHTEGRKRAIRRVMEKIILERKLQETADDWATPVSDLSPIVVNFAKK